MCGAGSSGVREKEYSIWKNDACNQSDDGKRKLSYSTSLLGNEQIVNGLLHCLTNKVLVNKFDYKVLFSRIN